MINSFSPVLFSDHDMLIITSVITPDSETSVHLHSYNFIIVSCGPSDNDGNKFNDRIN